MNELDELVRITQENAEIAERILKRLEETERILKEDKEGNR